MEEQNSLEDMVNRATSEVLDGIVDWGLNLEICDAVASNPLELAPNLVVAVELRLKSKNPKIQGLAVTLIETCVQNGSAEIHGAVGSKAFLSVLSSVAETSSSSETRDKALALIEQWGLAFESKRDIYPAYVETYANLKVRGVAFPERSDAPPVFTPAAHTSSNSQQEQNSSAVEDAALAKLQADLNVVAEKINLCNEMLPNSPGIENGDDALAEVVGFLEACRPRMLTLIDAASRGVLTDDLLAFALKVNDNLAKALEDEINSSKSIDAINPNTNHSQNQSLGQDIFAGGNDTPLQPVTAPAPISISQPLADMALEEDDDDASDALQTGARQPRMNQPPHPAMTTATTTDNSEKTTDLLDFGAGIPPEVPSSQPPPSSQQSSQPDLL